MTLIGILAAILFERVLGQLPGWGDARVLPWLLRNVERWVPWPALWRNPIVLLLWIVLPVWWVGMVLEGIPSPILQVLLSAAVLLLCLGPRDLAGDIHRLQAAHEAGDQAAERRLTQSLRWDAPQAEPSHRSLLGSLFIQSHERLFGVLMGFLAFGAAGALAAGGGVVGASAPAGTPQPGSVPANASSSAQARPFRAAGMVMKEWGE